MKTALITGIAGQDGSYLAESLLRKGYDVHGMIRRSSSITTHRLDSIDAAVHEARPGLTLHYGDMSDSNSLSGLLFEIRPDEIYHLAAQSHVQVSYELPEYTADITGTGSIRLLEAIRLSGSRPRFYQASSSEMFGAAPPPHNEHSAFHPRSPYASAKVFAYHAMRNYREAYGLFAANGILMNHESPRRGETFVTRKITRAVAAIEAGEQDLLFLGNLDARRDWGFAGDYVEAMWLILQHDVPEDFVIATGEDHSVREFCEFAFDCAGLDWERYVRVDPRYERPADVDHLCGDPSKARNVLGWTPTVSFRELIVMMVDSDRATLAKSRPFLYRDT